MRFLLVDDNPIDLLVNEKVITNQHAQHLIHKVRSGPEALDYLAQTDELPDIILLDIKMPIMDGFAFIDEYRKLNEDITSHIRIYMVSSSIDPNDLRRVDESQWVNWLIEKPLTREAVEKIT